MRRMRVIGAVTVLTTAFGLIGGHDLGSAQSPSTWPTFHGDLARDGFSATAGPRTSIVSNEWQLPKPTVSSPAVDASGTAYIGDNDGKVYALAPSSPLSPKWSFTTGGPVVSSPSLSPDGKTLYVGSDDGSVYALNTSDGSKKWSVSLGGQVEGSPLVSPDGGTIYVTSVNGTVEGLQASDGTVAWHNAIAAIPGSLALGADGNTLYVATATDYLYALPTSGSTAGQPSNAYYLDAPAAGSPAIDTNGNIYVVTQDGTLMSFSPGNGSATWSFKLPSPLPAYSTPAVNNGLVVFGDGDQTFYGVNASNGQVTWTAHGLDALRSSPAISGGSSMVYVGTDLGYVYAFDLNGHVVWVKQVGTSVDSSPAIGGDGSLWVGSQSGIVYRFHDQTVPPPPSSVPTGTARPATATPSVTPSATVTPTTTLLTFTRKSKVAGGSKQFITIHTTAHTVVHIRVDYPNGTHQSHHGTSNGSGTLKYHYTQGASKITKANQTATITVKAGTASLSKTYQILFAKIDVAVSPPATTAGKRVTIWVHTRSRTPVVIRIVSPNGKSSTLQGKTGKHGWAHVTYKVAKKLLRGHKTKLNVLAQTKNSPFYSTKVSLNVTK